MLSHKIKKSGYMICIENVNEDFYEVKYYGKISSERLMILGKMSSNDKKSILFTEMNSY